MERSRFSLQQVLDLKAYQKMQILQELSRLEKEKSALELRIKAIASNLSSEEKALQEEMHQLVAGEIRIRVAYLDYMNKEMTKEIINLKQLCEKMAPDRQRLLQCIQDEQVLRLFLGKVRSPHQRELCSHAKPLRDIKTARKIIHDTAKSTFCKKYIS